MVIGQAEDDQRNYDDEAYMDVIDDRDGLGAVLESKRTAV